MSVEELANIKMIRFNPKKIFFNQIKYVMQMFICGWFVALVHPKSLLVCLALSRQTQTDK